MYDNNDWFIIIFSSKDDFDAKNHNILSETMSTLFPFVMLDFIMLLM